MIDNKLWKNYSVLSFAVMGHCGVSFVNIRSAHVRKGSEDSEWLSRPVQSDLTFVVDFVKFRCNSDVDVRLFSECAADADMCLCKFSYFNDEHS